MTTDERRRSRARSGGSKNIAGDGDVRSLTLVRDDSSRTTARVALTLLLRPHRAARPSDFGLARRDLQNEVSRCRANGWEPWELRQRFTDPATIPVEGWGS